MNKMNNKVQEEAVISILILLSISDNELHKKEREFIENLISEKEFLIDIDKELDQIHDKFRDDFDTASIYYINTIQDIYLQKITIELMRRLAAADLIIKDREIKFLELVKKEWKT
tara:strand:+ start:1577 stop:1921 length:345 start_codon:yes stop_codon:yes gene_type:complete